MSSYKNGKSKLSILTFTPSNGQFIFGNNIIGSDGWPASRPNQSNLPFTNGISACKVSNGYGPYVYGLIKINFENNSFMVPNIYTFKLVNNNNNNPYVREYNTGNDVILNSSLIKYMILAKDLMKNDDIIGLGKVKDVKKVFSNRLNTCCLCNTSV